jgi:hypothetical protein
MLLAFKLLPGMHMRQVLGGGRVRARRTAGEGRPGRLLQGVVNRHRRLSARKWLAAFGFGLWVGVVAGFGMVQAVSEVEDGSFGVDLGEVVEVMVGWG